MELEITRLGKHYKPDVWALKDVTMCVNTGILGILGPNGAGKTTLMSILATLTQATEGRVRWDGKDLLTNPNLIRPLLGYLPQEFGVYPHLTAIEFLEYLAAVKGLEKRTARRRIDELLITLNLFSVRKRPLGEFSGGMKQRIGIAQALLNNPHLLILDEPASGLDPAERIRFRNILTALSDRRTVILSTHIMSDIEAIATEIAVFARGRLLSHSSIRRLLQQAEGQVWERVVPSNEVGVSRGDEIVTSTLKHTAGTSIRVLASSAPTGAHLATPTLEEAYLHCLSSRTNEVTE